MEDIYTIKVRTNPDARDLYPSERRYSASTVLGLSVVHLSLALTALLLASLSLNTHGLYTDVTTKSDLPIQYENFTDFNNTESKHRDDVRNDDMAFLDEEEIEEERIVFENEFKIENIYSPFFSMTLAPSLMSLGALLSGCFGLLAWKRWYIDHNIKWFFLTSFLSVITSFICLIVTGLTLAIINEHNQTLQSNNAFIFSFNNNNVYIDRLKQQSVKNPNIKLVLAVNLMIATILEFVWSILSTKISWKGMRNSYPDDIVLSRGKIEVNTVHKGNKKSKAIAPDILNHYPKKKKFAKYFPKKENDFLPKQESNTEYQERVNKFLSSSIHEPDN